MKKRGQFFLVTAIIIVGLLIGLTATINTVRTTNERNYFYDLSDEIGFETKRVIDYGVYRGDKIEDLARDSLEEYANYIAHDKVIFIYGDAGQLYALAFEESERGRVGISTGVAIPATIEIQYTGEVNADVTDERNPQTGEIEKVKVAVREEEKNAVYEFDLRDGENFFFLIVKEEDDEKFVATAK